ncbi:MAG: hypothetical protein ACRDRC_04110 [Pseudonocardiaceae bacterium]
MLQSQRRAHARIAAGLFAGLGVQVGAWAVLIPELVASRDLTPAELGAALAVMAATSIAALAAAGQVTRESLASAALLTPFLLAGFALSGPARRVLDNGWTRRAVLAVAAASAALLIGRVVLS